MRVSEEVRKCVVFIGLPITMPDGLQGLSFKGTAFFVSVPSESIKGVYHVYLVTAKHVAKKLEGQTFMIRINTQDGKSALVIGERTQRWYYATDKSVDVALISYLPPKQFDYRHIPTTLFLPDEEIRSKRIDVGDEVFVTGLFAHLTGAARNLPIVRTGNIAMMPDEPVPTKELGDIEAYLIEARSIGGLSGSPAFVRQGNKTYLLGLMHGHWDVSEADVDVIKDKTNQSVNMGIAIVIPVTKILEVINQDALVKQREQYEKERRDKKSPVADMNKREDSLTRE